MIVRQSPRFLLVFLAALSAGASPALAQQRELPARPAPASQFETDVDALVRELMQARRQSFSIVQTLQRLDVTLRAQNLRAAQRAQLESDQRQLGAQLNALESDGRRIQKALGEICAVDRTPEGWAGVAFSASASYERHDDGRVILRFIDYPSIESVEPGSPAEKAGIQGGDLLLSMAGEDLKNHEIVFSSLLKPGARIPFKVRRGVETRQFMVLIEPRPDDFSTPCPWVDERIAAAFAPLRLRFSIASGGQSGAESPDAAPGTRVIVQRTPVVPRAATLPTVVPVPPLPPLGFATGSATVAFAGAQLIAMNADLADALGVDRGLLVTIVGRGSPAEQSGLRAGDVLVAVDGRTLTSPLTFLQAVEQSEGRAIRLQLLRKKKPMAVTLSW